MPEDSFDDLPAAPLTFDTWEEWQEYVNADLPLKPTKPSQANMRALSKDKTALAAFNEQRMDYHDSFGPIMTSDLHYVHDQVLPLIYRNLRASPGARRGAVIDGDGTVGKTTIMASLGKVYEQEMRKRYPAGRTRRNDVYCPVAYVTLRGSTTTKGLTTKLANFYNTPYGKRASEDTITDLVVDNMKRCATTLVLVDDIGNVKMRTKSGQDINNHLKYLVNCVPATFIYAGIDVENSEFFSEGKADEKARKSQTLRRFLHLKIEPYRYNDAADIERWRKLLEVFEDNLILGHKARGALVGLERYLWNRTSGYMGALSDLIRAGANKAILTGKEQITEGLLDTILLDQGAEEDFARRQDVKGGKTT